jgi:hypothetical protein
LSVSNLAHFTLLCGWLSEFASQSMLHAVRQATLTCVLPVLPGGFGQSGSEGLRRCRPISPQWCQPNQAEAPCRGRPPLCPPRAGASRLVGGSDGAVVFCAFFFLRRFLGLSRPLRFLTAAIGCSSLISGFIGGFGGAFAGQTSGLGRLSLRRRRLQAGPP